MRYKYRMKSEAKKNIKRGFKDIFMVLSGIIGVLLGVLLIGAFIHLIGLIDYTEDIPFVLQIFESFLVGLTVILTFLFLTAMFGGIIFDTYHGILNMYEQYPIDDTGRHDEM